jgi:uncharacterized metal-binding protein YceD (DUF177 family)
MPAGPPDLLDTVRLAEERAVIERVYRLGEFPRLADVLAERGGEAAVRFEFFKISGHAAAKIASVAEPRLICQRCMRPMSWRIGASSVVEFARQDEVDGFDKAQELHITDDGFASLKELAEEELLLALPLAPMCESAQCSAAGSAITAERESEAGATTQRPFADLKKLLKRT